MENFLEKGSKDNGKDILADLGALILELISTRKDIDFAELQLKGLNEKEEGLSREEIPQLLLERGLTSITMDTGEKVSIDEKIHVTLPKDPSRRRTVLAWLINQGGEHLIKKELKVEEPERKVVDFLIKNGIPHVTEETIHSASLKAFIQAKLGIAKGSLQEIEVGEVPKEANLFVYNETKIK